MTHADTSKPPDCRKPVDRRRCRHLIPRRRVRLTTKTMFSSAIIFTLFLLQCSKASIVGVVSECASDHLNFTIDSAVTGTWNISDKDDTCNPNSEAIKDTTVTINYAECGIKVMALQPYGYAFLLQMQAVNAETNETKAFSVQCFYSSSYTYNSSVGVGGSSDNWNGGGHTGGDADVELNGSFKGNGEVTKEVKMGDDVEFVIETTSTSYAAIMPKRCKFGNESAFGNGAEIPFAADGCPVNEIPGVISQMTKVSATKYKLSFKAFKLEGSGVLHVTCEVLLCPVEALCARSCWSNSTETETPAENPVEPNPETTAAAATEAAETVAPTEAGRKKRAAGDGVESKTFSSPLTVSELGDYIDKTRPYECVPKHMLHAAYVAVGILAAVLLVCLIIIIGLVLCVGRRGSKYVEQAHTSQYPLASSMSSLGSYRA